LLSPEAKLDVLVKQSLTQGSIVWQCFMPNLFGEGEHSRTRVCLKVVGEAKIS
jgi:hypothetical protein